MNNGDLLDLYLDNALRDSAELWAGRDHAFQLSCEIGSMRALLSILMTEFPEVRTYIEQDIQREAA